MSYKPFLIFLLFFSLCGCNHDNGSQSESLLDIKSNEIIKSFFSELHTRNKTAIVNLLRQNENIDLNDSSTLNLVKKFNDINELSGKLMSEKLLRKKLLGDDLGVYIYLVKYESKFYRFVFTFYNNDVTTKVYKFSFDDTADLEIEEGLKLYTN